MESQKMITGFSAQSIPSLYMHLQQQQQKRTTIGFVVEVVQSEMRVALTPAAVRELVSAGQTVYFQAEAGMTAGFTDEMYKQAGATKLSSAQEVYQRSHIMMKVQQPTSQEYHMIQPQQVIFCFMACFESINSPAQQQNLSQFKQVMSQRQGTIFAYESMLKDDWTAPVMNALSEVAGDMAVQQGMRMMETKYGGKGELLGQVAGEEGARVLIIGSGVAAMRAARMASAVGAQVTVMDLATENLRWIGEQLKTPVQTMTYNAENLEKMLPETKILIGAVIPTMYEEESRQQNTLAQIYSKNLKPVVSTNQLMLLNKNSIVIDLAVAYGGNIELDTRTFHFADKDTWTNGQITLYAPNSITNQVPNSASKAFANAALPYVKKVAFFGWQLAAAEDKAIRRAAVVADGHLQSLPLWDILSEKINSNNLKINSLTSYETQKPIYSFFEDNNRRIDADQQKAVKHLLNIINNNNMNMKLNPISNTNSNNTISTRFPIEA